MDWAYLKSPRRSAVALTFEMMPSANFSDFSDWDKFVAGFLVPAVKIIPSGQVIITVKLI